MWSQQNEWDLHENERENEEKQQQKIETDNRCERILNNQYLSVEFMSFTDLYNVIKEKSQCLKYKYYNNYNNNNNNENLTFKDQIDIIKRLIENLKKPSMIFFNDNKKYNNAKQYIFDDINLNQIFSSVDNGARTNNEVIESLNSNQKGGLKHKTNKNRKKKQKNKKTKSTRRRRR